MREKSWPNSFRFRCALAIGAGLLLTLSFPKPGISMLAWVAPGLLLASALGLSGGERFRAGYLGGLAHFLSLLYWLLFIPFPVGAVLGWIALSAYLALYPAIWVWLCWKFFPNTTRPENSNWRGQIEAFAGQAFPRRQLWLLFCAAGWVALEVIRGMLFSGFPWNFLGVSQFKNLPVIQIASITGAPGVSFLVAWTSLGLASAGMILIARPSEPRRWRLELILPMLMVVFVIGAGVRKVVSPRVPNRTITAALVQPSIPQTLIWDPRESSNRFNQLLQISERALATQPKPGLLIWPEAAVPNLLRYERENFEAITNLVRRHHVWMILGADDAEPRPGTGEPPRFDYFNSSFLISPDGELAGAYRKRQLVIFGEYTPFSRWLPFLAKLFPAGEGFQAGAGAAPFRIEPLDIKISVLICFEDTFAGIARRDVEPDTDFLLNLTNNGWFGESAAQWQHAANAAFRAVENGVPLVRCTNNGLTCWVDEMGAMREIFSDGSEGEGNVYGPGFKLMRVPLLPKGARREPTFYNRHGDWFAWGCVSAVAGALIVRLGAKWSGRWRRSLAVNG